MAVKQLLLAAIFLVDVGITESALSFASYYGDHMVLQQAPKRSQVWGYADTEGTTVTVTLTGFPSINTTVVRHEELGRNIWKVLLPAAPPSGPHSVHTLTAESSDGSAMLQDVLFGDVWLCSGQSNMQFTLDMVFNATEEVKDAVNYPYLRLFTVALKSSATQKYDLLEIEEKWSLPNKDTVGHSNWSYFSAVCWLYGKYLYQKLLYPIGLIDTDWGGTPIEAWSSPDALAQCDPSKPEEDNLEYIGSDPKPNERSVLWNSMIHPFLNMTIYGAIWYQGEANAGSPDSYKCRFPAMINDWRMNFNLGSENQTDILFPFGFVQLAPWRNDSSIIKGFPDIRWHQTADYGFVPNPDMPKTFMAVAIDLPDFTSPYNSIHPRDKQDVASRLVLSALAVAYNRNPGKFQGPMISAFYIDIGYFTLGLEFDNGTSALDVRATDGFEICCSLNNQSLCNGSDSKWIQAPIIKHTSTMVTLSYKDGCSREYVMGLRYLWRESPCSLKKCAVYSVENNLPVPPFVTKGLIGGRSLSPILTIY